MTTIWGWFLFHLTGTAAAAEMLLSTLMLMVGGLLSWTALHWIAGWI